MMSFEEFLERANTPRGKNVIQIYTTLQELSIDSLRKAKDAAPTQMFADVIDLMIHDRE